MDDKYFNNNTSHSPSPQEGKGTRKAGGMGLINQAKPTHIPVSKQTRNLMIEQAREMRRFPTEAEALLWAELKNRKLAGNKFRRQHPIGPFIVDFYCPMRKLIIEIDGLIHLEQKAYDETREDFLLSMGYMVLRFTNQQVEHRLNWVVQEIYKVITNSNE